MSWFQKMCHRLFHWDYVYFHGQIFSGPLKVHWLPNGEAYVMRDKMIRIPNKLPVEGSHLDVDRNDVKIVPLTPHITWYKEEH